MASSVIRMVKTTSGPVQAGSGGGLGGASSGLARGNSASKIQVYGPLVAAAAEEAQDGDEDGGADDAPDDGEGHAADIEGDQAGQAELARDPQAEEGADEAQDHRAQAAGAGEAPQARTQRPADAGDQQKDEERD